MVDLRCAIGIGENRFYQGGDGSITPLLTEAQCASVDPWSLVGYVVARWRRVYLTSGEARRHLICCAVSSSSARPRPR